METDPILIKSNIALIGMMAVGKTSVGKALSELLNKKFYDTDAIFVSRFGNISEFFKSKGEEEFRRLEKEISVEAALNDDSVISLGGGAVLNPELMKIIRARCKVVLLTSGVDILVTRINCNAERPLIKAKEDIYKILSEREYLYKKYADTIFDTSYTEPVSAAEKISELIEKLN